MSASEPAQDVVRISIDRGLLRGLAVALAAGLLLALTEAVGMSGTSLLFRLGYWLPLMLLGSLWGHLCSLLVERYEQEHFPIDLPSPIAAIRFRMEQQGLKAKDLIPHFGSASKVSEVLSGRRRLSLAMIRSLIAGLSIPAQVLLQDSTPAPRRVEHCPA